MPNFDLSGIALSMVCPTNKLITDDKGLPGAYVYRPKKMLSELISGGSASIVHPAFMVCDVQQEGIYFGKYQGMIHNNRIYSLPCEDPAANIDLDTFAAYCHNKGRGHHCITAAEWGYLALLAKKLGKQPKGNNDYGKDHTETSRIAIPTYTYNSNGSTVIGRVATGTGPLTWSDTGDLDGIFDLNGNVWEWVKGVRLVKGELQVIPFNNAASPDVDASAASGAWRALNATATSYADLFVVPNGQGTTAGTVKLDFVSSHWQWGVTISLFAFTIAMVKIYQECGGVPDTLVTCVFATLGGECGIMGWIKTTKERNKERRWEKEDKREAEEPLDKKTMEE